MFSLRQARFTRFLVRRKLLTSAESSSRIPDHAEEGRQSEKPEIAEKPPTFPWSSGNHNWPSDPLFHRLAGKYLLGTCIRGTGNFVFSESEFCRGVEIAVARVAELISSDVTGKEITPLVDEPLLDKLRWKYQNLNTLGYELGLNVEKVSEVCVTCYRSLIGRPLSTEDVKKSVVLGQTVRISAEKLKSVMESSPSWTRGKIIGEEATRQGLEYRLTVNFQTKERFYIRHKDSKKIAFGSLDLVNSTHAWVFSAILNWQWHEEYPLDWIVCDIDNTMGYIHKLD